MCRLHSSSSFSLMRVLTPSPNRVPSGRTMAARPPVLEQVHDKDKEEVGGFPGAKGGGKVGLDAVLLGSAEGRVGDDYIDPIPGAVIAQGAPKGIVVADVELPGVPRALQALENLLVDVAEDMPVGGAIEVDLVDLVDHLADEGADLHVVVGILEDRTYHEAAPVGADAELQLLEGLEEVVVDDFADLGMDVPAGCLERRGNELGADVTLAEKLLVHAACPLVKRQRMNTGEWTGHPPKKRIQIKSNT